MHHLHLGNCFEVLPKLSPAACVFADPFDNIGLDYDDFNDQMSHEDYAKFLSKCVTEFTKYAPIVWLSFNAKHTFEMGAIFKSFLQNNPDWKARAGVQTFTFGQDNKNEMSNCHRPLWRLFHKEARFYPEQIKIKSWRLEHGDPRADPGGKVPGDVFDFPRVTGNSRQRRPYHKTQLNEGLVARCIKFSTQVGERVIDPFAGTATVLRVCKAYERLSTSVEVSTTYCKQIVAEHQMQHVGVNHWQLEIPEPWW